MNEEKPTEDFGTPINSGESHTAAPLPASSSDEASKAQENAIPETQVLPENKTETAANATQEIPQAQSVPETQTLPEMQQGAPNVNPSAPQGMPAGGFTPDNPNAQNNPFASGYTPLASGFVRMPDGTYAQTYFPYQYQNPKQKRRWTTGALAAAAAIGLAIGGLLGGTAGVAFSDNYYSQSQDYNSQRNGSIYPGQNGDSQVTNPWGNSSATGLEQGTKVNNAPGVVLINSTLYNGQGAGTGIVLNKSGIVVTNYHVVEGSTQVTVTTADGSKSYSATVIGHNQKKDVAVLQIADAPDDLETVTIADSSVKIGDTVYAQGNGSGQGYITELEGKVTGLDESITASDRSNQEESNKLTGLIKTDADLIAGYSGGPLMNSDHEVVGIDTAASTGSTSEQVDGYAIPISKVMEIVDSIIKGDSSDGNVIGRNAALGITVTTVNVRTQRGAARAVQIQEVNDGSGAQAAGLQAGDIITALNGTSVSSSSDLADSIKAKAIGDKVNLTILRNNQELTVTVTLSEAIVN